MNGSDSEGGLSRATTGLKRKSTMGLLDKGSTMRISTANVFQSQNSRCSNQDEGEDADKVKDLENESAQSSEFEELKMLSMRTGLVNTKVQRKQMPSLK